MFPKVGVTSRSDLSRCHVPTQQPQTGFVRRIQNMLEPGMNAYQQIAKPGQSSSLLLDQIGSPANNDANPDLEVTSLVEHSQITSGPELIGDDSRIPRIA